MSKVLKAEYYQLYPKSALVTFYSSNRAKYIRISINVKLQVKVTVPERIKIIDAKIFFESKISWVKNSLIRLEKKQTALINNNDNIVLFRKKLSAEEFLTKNLYLVQRCQELAKKHKFKIGKVVLRRQKTIWGSCSSKNNISLNVNLVFLKNELIDYVILHELTHTKIKNHSKKFWNKLEELLSGAKLLDKKLRCCRPDFHVI